MQFVLKCNTPTHPNYIFKVYHLLHHHIVNNLTPQGQSKIFPKSLNRFKSSIQFNSLYKIIGISCGRFDCMDDIFVKLGLFTQTFSRPRVRHQNIIIYLCTLVLSDTGDCPNKIIHLGFNRLKTIH